jgi:flagellar basal-body rod protein FlgF
MDPLTTAAAAGMRSRLESLDLLANNLANSSATGFKGDSEFYNLYVSNDSSSEPPSNLLTEPIVERHWTNFSQGTFSTTQNPLDLAVAGRGFFAVNSGNGVLYTRDGNFTLSAKKQLQTKDGYLLRGKDGKPISVDPNKAVEVAPDGTLQQDGIAIATIDLVDFPDLHALSKQGDNYFQLSSDTIQPTAAKGGEILQGKLENANVQPAESAVRLVTVMRQFEMLQRAMTIGADMNKRTTDDVARAT